MNALSSTRSVKEAAQALSQQSHPAKAEFHRVLVRRLGARAYTTVSISKEAFSKASRFTYGNPAGVTAALRRAALQVQDTRNGCFSELVREKALAALRGAYQPAKAAALAEAREAAARLAEENNSAWSCAG
jgi:hypothetical protein